VFTAMERTADIDTQNFSEILTTKPKTFLQNYEEMGPSQRLWEDRIDPARVLGVRQM